MKKRFGSLLILITIFLMLSGCANNSSERIELIESKVEEPKKSEVTMTITGDIMFHPWTFMETKNKDGKYDFSYFYSEVRDFISEADLTIGNFESTSTPTRKMEGYPRFNTPEEAIVDLKNSGFDILTTANNHCLDTGTIGIEHTIESLDKNGMKHTGTWKKEGKDYLIEEVNGIKIGFLAYTQRFNGLETSLKEDEKSMLSYADEEVIKKDIEYLKEKNVDYIIVFPHWGEEYTIVPDATQKELGHKILDFGADLVLGSHPHVLQPIETVEKNGEKKYIVYSMGNSISGQRERFMDTSNTEVGMFVNISLEKNEEGNKTTLKKFNVEPTWVREENIDDKKVLQTVLMRDYLKDGRLQNTVSVNELNRILNMRVNAINILESMGYDTKLN